MTPKLARLASSYWYMRMKRKNTLSSLQLDVTSKCNLRCKTCYFFKNDSNITQDMSLSEIEKLFLKYRENNIYNVWLFGGEPTLRPDVIELADQYFPLVTVISNGQLKIPEKYNKFKIHISVDGVGNTNDFIRGHGTFDKIINNYIGDKRVIFNITITKQNVAELSDSIRFLKKLKTAGVEFQLFSPSDMESEYDKMSILDDDDYDLAFSTLRKYNLHPNVFVTNAIIDSWSNTKLNKDCCIRNYINCYASDGVRKYCCTPGVKCSDCKMLPTHFLEVIDTQNDLLTKLKFTLWS